MNTATFRRAAVESNADSLRSMEMLLLVATLGAVDVAIWVYVILAVTK